MNKYCAVHHDIIKGQNDENQRVKSRFNKQQLLLE